MQVRLAPMLNNCGYAAYFNIEQGTAQSTCAKIGICRAL